MGLASLEYIKNPNIFLLVSFASQAAGGIGAGALATSSMAVLGSFPHDEREKYIGWIEAANGIGLLFGPLTGALLYNIGGYQAPFIAMATLLMIAFPIITLQFSRCQEEQLEFQALL